MLRNLCGLRCLNRPRGTLVREDLEFVKHKLAKFKAVLILENFDESMRIMNSKFGWDVLKFDSKTLASKKLDRKKLGSKSLKSQNFWNRYKNQHDIKGVSSVGVVFSASGKTVVIPQCGNEILYIVPRNLKFHRKR